MSVTAKPGSVSPNVAAYQQAFAALPKDAVASKAQFEQIKALADKMTPAERLELRQASAATMRAQAVATERNASATPAQKEHAKALIADIDRGILPGPFGLRVNIQTGEAVKSPVADMMDLKKDAVRNPRG